MRPSTPDYDKQVRLEMAYEIIAHLDDSVVKTEWIDKAIQKLEDLKHIRENLPF